MTFLNPAVLFGLLAASIPIVLHFFNLRKLKKINFSTLAFLKELQKTKIRRIKLKQWLLLLLRVLIIVSLVMAFARPTVRSFPFTSGKAKTSAVFMIDNTFSMSVIGDYGTYLNQSKQIAKNLLGNFEDGDEIAILPFSVGSDISRSLKTNPGMIKKEIDEIQIKQGSPTLNEALIKAGNILYNSKNFNKEIYLFTDLQKSRLYNSSNELSNLSSLFGGNIRTYIIAHKEKSIQNLGVDRLSINNQIFEKNKAINFSSKITNYSSIPVSNSVASLFINGKRSAQQNVTLMPGESKEFFFETTITDTGLVEVNIELEDDDILDDNKRYTSFYLPDHYSALIVNDAAEDSKFIKLALGDQAQRIKITEISSAQFSSYNLSRYDAIILFVPGNIFRGDQLLNFVSSGGGLILFPGSKTTLGSYQDICKMLGVNPPVSIIGKIGSTELSTQFDKVEMAHSIISDLFEKNSKPQIDSPEIYYYFRIFTGSKGRNIISLFDKSSFFSEYKLGSGKILNFNSAPTLGWNTFPLKALFAPLINKSLMYVSSKSKDEKAIIAGNEMLADITGLTTGNIKVVTPGNRTELIDSDTLYNKNYFEYKNTNASGLYKFYSGNKLLDHIPVNHDERESNLERISESGFSDYLSKIDYKGSITFAEPEDNLQKTIYQSRYGTELWKFFIIAALVLALIEMLTARNSKKDIIDITEK